MMQVKVAGEMLELSLIDPDSGVDFVRDFIGNNGGSDSFVYNGDEYECSKDTFDWWKKVIDDQQRLIDRISDLKDRRGRVFVDEVIESIPDCDLEDHAAIVNAALDEAFPPFGSVAWAERIIADEETKEDKLGALSECINFWQALELLIKMGWGRDDFEEANIAETFENFDNHVEENWDYLDEMIRKGEGTMRYWMVHGGNGGEQLGCWQAGSAAEALGMLAKAAGYASKEEADRVLQESGGHVYPEEVEEITEDEYNAVEALLAAGYSDQGDALRDYREAVDVGDTWMLDTIVYGSLDEWKGLTLTEFNQALSNANHDPFPAFETSVETDAAYDSAWKRLQKEIAAEMADAAYQEHNKREIREGLEAHGRDEFNRSNEEA